MSGDEQEQDNDDRTNRTNSKERTADGEFSKFRPMTLRKLSEASERFLRTRSTSQCRCEQTTSQTLKTSK